MKQHSTYSTDMLLKGKQRNIPSQSEVDKRLTVAFQTAAPLYSGVSVRCILSKMPHCSSLTQPLRLFTFSYSGLSGLLIEQVQMYIFFTVLSNSKRVNLILHLRRLFTWAGHVKAPRETLLIEPQHSSSWH